jgi:hypothetical protein
MAGGNNDCGTENHGASDGGERSVAMNFVTGDDADNPTSHPYIRDTCRGRWDVILACSRLLK